MLLKFKKPVKIFCLGLLHLTLIGNTFAQVDIEGEKKNNIKIVKNKTQTYNKTKVTVTWEGSEVVQIFIHTEKHNHTEKLNMSSYDTKEVLLDKNELHSIKIVTPQKTYSAAQWLTITGPGQLSVALKNSEVKFVYTSDEDILEQQRVDEELRLNVIQDAEDKKNKKLQNAMNNYLEGEKEYKKGNYDLAIQDYEKSLSYVDDYKVRTRLDDAKKMKAKKEVDDKNKYARQYQDMGDDYYNKGKYSDALTYYQYSLNKVDDSNVVSKKKLAQEKLTQQEADDFEKAGDAYFNSTNYKQAIDKYQKSLNLVYDSDVKKKKNNAEVAYSKQLAKEQYDKGESEFYNKNYSSSVDHLTKSIQYYNTTEASDLLKKANYKVRWKSEQSVPWNFTVLLRYAPSISTLTVSGNEDNSSQASFTPITFYDTNLKLTYKNYIDYGFFWRGGIGMSGHGSYYTKPFSVDTTYIKIRTLDLEVGMQYQFYTAIGLHPFVSLSLVGMYTFEDNFEEYAGTDVTSNDLNLAIRPGAGFDWYLSDEVCFSFEYQFSHTFFDLMVLNSSLVNNPITLGSRTTNINAMDLGSFYIGLGYTF